MSTANLALPQRIEDDGIVAFIEQLLSCDAADEIVVDAVAAQEHTASALAAFAAMQRRWENPSLDGRKARKIELLNFQQWPMHPCFKGEGIARGVLGEGTAIGLTSPVCEARPVTGDVERVASELAKRVAPEGWGGGPLYPLVEYCFGELLRNCVQHTGEVSFAVVQERCDALGDLRYVRLAVADCGRGVRLSFIENESPKAHPEMTDAEAIERAIAPLVSSTVHLPRLPYGRSSNMGIGLSMVRQLARATAGHFMMLSGSAWLHQIGNSSDRVRTGAQRWPGSIVSISLGVKEMTTYGEMLAAARDAIGLTPRRNTARFFL